MNLVPIEHGGQRVLTTQQLAEFYGEPPVKLQQNFSNNRQRYAEGEHFFRIEHGQEGYSKFSSSPYATQPIYLWTEKGALYHAKSLNTGCDYGIYAGLRVRISHKKEYATIRAKEKPENIVCGEWVGN